MNDMTPTREQREAKLEGMGCKRKRVEDIRFTQGKGNYVDDMKLPGMLHGDFVRSPHAHARVKAIRKELSWSPLTAMLRTTASPKSRWNTNRSRSLSIPSRQWIWMRRCCARTS